MANPIGVLQRLEAGDTVGHAGMALRFIVVSTVLLDPEYLDRNGDACDSYAVAQTNQGDS